MSKIFDAAGDVVDSAVDVVTDNKEILAAIALAYATGGASVPETVAADTFGSSTAVDIAANEAAAAASATTAQTTAAQTLAQNKAIQEGLYSQAAADAATKTAFDAKASIVPPSINQNNPFQSAFFGDVPGVSPAIASTIASASVVK